MLNSIRFWCRSSIHHIYFKTEFANTNWRIFWLKEIILDSDRSKRKCVKCCIFRWILRSFYCSLSKSSSRYSQTFVRSKNLFSTIFTSSTPNLTWNIWKTKITFSENFFWVKTIQFAGKATVSSTSFSFTKDKCRFIGRITLSRT
jgi:hypothetical protein